MDVMTDLGHLKIMSIFEIGPRIHCSTEITCLAAYTYHKFYRNRPEMTQYDMYLIGAACIRLAYYYYERPINLDHLVLALHSVQNGVYTEISKMEKMKLAFSIRSAMKIIMININFQILYNDERILTPGDLAANYGISRTMPPAPSAPVRSADTIYLYDDEPQCEHIDSIDWEARLLTRNDRSQLSIQRYLAHYLATIKMTIADEYEFDFKRFCNIAWTFAADFHWAPQVLANPPNVVACVTLMMAVELLKPSYLNHRSPPKKAFGKLIDKKWNLIFCDDLNDLRYKRLRNIIVNQYMEYDRLIQHQFHTIVIDPKLSERRRKQFPNF